MANVQVAPAGRSPEEKLRLTPRQAAERLAVSPITIRRMVGQGMFTAIPAREGERGPGKRYYLAPGEIEAYANGGETTLREYRARNKKRRAR